MNERIRELAQEVFSFKYKLNPNELNPDHNMDHIHKFAELIVQECISQIDAQCFPTQSHELVQKSAWNAYLRATIKQHFGG